MVGLAPEQRKVFEALKDRSKGSCLITGDAGTGKTTLAARLAQYVLDSGRYVLILCPTHVAKQQFSARLKPHDRLSVMTVAKYLGQFPKVDKESGRMKFTPGSGSDSAEADLVIVDETSMVSEYELTEIRRARLNSLVVFLGDFAQLKPVMKAQGDAWQHLKTFYLKVQHRNHSAILDLCNVLREKVVYPDVDEGEITVHQSRRDLVRRFLVVLERSKDKRDVCYLAYRNDVVNRVRMMAHELLHGNKPFARGQWLRLDQMCAAGHNGSVVRVLGGGYSHDHTALGQTFRVYHVRVENYDEGDIYELLMARLEDQWRLRCTVKALYEESARHFRRDKDQWQATRELIDETTAIVLHSSPYVGTVHKSQGRSIPRVFVDTKDVSTGSDKRRLMYVGCSRAMRELHTIRIPPKIRKRR